MTGIRRIVSGSTAAWTNIAISILAQVGLVPVYLNHWDANYYGIWLGILAVPGFLIVVSSAYQDFVGFELLKIGGRDLVSLERFFWSAVPFSAAIGTMELLIAFMFVYGGGVGFLLGQSTVRDSTTLAEAELVVLLVVGVWAVFGTVGTLFVRLLAPLGYYPKMAWWGVRMNAANVLAPGIAVVLGAGIKGAGLTLMAVVLVFNLWMLVEIRRILRFVGFSFRPPVPRVGALALWHAQVLALTKLLGMARESGPRLILVPLAGAEGLAGFATMRTAAGVSRQGLATITGPLMPELMRVLKDRDQPRCEAAFGIVWIVLVVILAPAVVMLQAVVGPLFLIWTRGQIAFDPILFGLLSISVLVFAWAQPAMAVVAGQNLLRPQLLVAVMAASIVVAGMLISVPVMGIVGTGVSLLAAELVAALLIRTVAERWLAAHSLAWPRRAARSAAFAVWIATAAIAALVTLPIGDTVVLIISFILFSLNALLYWRSLPQYARNRFAMILRTSSQ